MLAHLRGTWCYAEENEATSQILLDIPVSASLWRTGLLYLPYTPICRLSAPGTAVQRVAFFEDIYQCLLLQSARQRFERVRDCQLATFDQTLATLERHNAEQGAATPSSVAGQCIPDEDVSSRLVPTSSTSLALKPAEVASFMAFSPPTVDLAYDCVDLEYDFDSEAESQPPSFDQTSNATTEASASVEFVSLVISSEQEQQLKATRLTLPRDKARLETSRLAYVEAFGDRFIFDGFKGFTCRQCMQIFTETHSDRAFAYLQPIRKHLESCNGDGASLARDIRAHFKPSAKSLDLLVPKSSGAKLKLCPGYVTASTAFLLKKQLPDGHQLLSANNAAARFGHSDAAFTFAVANGTILATTCSGTAPSGLVRCHDCESAFHTAQRTTVYRVYNRSKIAASRQRSRVRNGSIPRRGQFAAGQPLSSTHTPHRYQSALVRGLFLRRTVCSTLIAMVLQLNRRTRRSRQLLQPRSTS